MPKFDPRASRGRRRAVTASARFAVDVLEPRRLFAFGQLDPTFDGDGYKVSDLPAPRVLVTESGKTVVVNIFAVDRLTTSGAFDTTFAGTGEVVIRDIRVEHAMQMSNGKMLLFGRTDDASGSVSSVIRLNIDGSRDATFGVGGIAPTGLASNDLIEDAAFSTNGTILVAGGRLGNAGGTSTISVARLTSAGAIDTTFAGDGVANDVEQIGGYLKPSTVADYYTDVAKLVPMPDGGVVVAAGGTYAYNFDYKQYFFRLTAAGTPATTFVSSGATLFDPTSGPDLLNDVVPLDGGGFVGVGRYNGGAAAYRFNADLSLDTSFGTAGHASITAGGVLGLGAAVRDSAGQIVAIGTGQSLLRPFRIDPSSGAVTAGPALLRSDLGYFGLRGLAAGPTNGSFSIATEEDAKDSVHSVYGLYRFQGDVAATPAPPSTVGWDQLAVPTEGATISLVGNTAPLAAGQTIAKWEWDYDYDGATFTLDATGKQPSITLGDGASTRSIALRVTDNYGQVVTTAQALRIANVAPVASFTANGGPSTATVYFDAIYDPSNADVAAGFTYSFDFNNDGDFGDPGDIAYTRSAGASSPAYSAPGTYSIRGRVTDKDGGFTEYVRTVTITGTTPPPGASNVGFTTANLFEGYDATLLGYATGLAAGQSIVKWEYDFNYDGKTFDVDANVQQPTIRGSTLDGPSTRTIAVRATDNYGQAVTRSQSLPIYNMGPDGTFSVVAGATAGTAVATYTNPLDPSAADQAAGFRYSFDFNGDDDFADPGEVALGTSPTLTFAYAAAGTYNVAGRVYDKDGGFTTRRGTVTVAAPTAASSQLTGSVIGTAGSFGNSGNTIAKAFDGSLATYVDLAAANGAWAGLDLGSAKTITSIQYAPRGGWASRMVGGTFQASTSADFSSGVVALATVSTKPAEGVLTTAAVTNATAYRYVRFLFPNGSYGNVAEIKFFGTGATTPPTYPPTNPPATGSVLAGTAFGTAGSFGNNGNTIAKAFDGSLATYVDLTAANGNVIGLDLGSAKTIAQIAFAPRASWSGRMIGGVFQGSNTADFSTGVTTLYTIAAKPPEGALTTVNSQGATAFRYVRYVAPSGSYGNVAEIQFLGSTGTTTPPPTPTATQLTGSVIGTAGSFGNGSNTIAKVFDDSLSTYFDAAQASGAWAGLDFGTARSITSIQYAPRSGWSSRMVGGLFQASTTADFSRGVVTLATVTGKPMEGVYTTVAVTTPGTYRYVRYLSPTNGYANVAEVKFFG